MAAKKTAAKKTAAVVADSSAEEVVLTDQQLADRETGRIAAEAKDAARAADDADAAKLSEEADVPAAGGVAVLHIPATNRTIEFTERNFGPTYREQAVAHAQKLAESGIKAELK